MTSQSNDSNRSESPLLEPIPNGTWPALRLIASFLVWTVPRPFRIAWTVARCVAWLWTRRLPSDAELIATWWQLGVLGLVFPWLMWLLLDMHNYFDPPPPSFLTGLGRLIWYVLITLCFCYPVELTSVAVGMMFARRNTRILWGLTPQMLIVFGLVGFANVICTQELLTSQSGFVASFPDPLWYGLHAASQLGAITFTVWWTRWVLARAATDRWVETVAAESQAMQSTPRKDDE